MKNVEVTVTIKIDGQEVPGFDPYLYRQSVDTVDSGSIEFPFKNLTLQSTVPAAMIDPVTNVLRVFAAIPENTDFSFYPYIGTILTSTAAHANIGPGGLILCINANMLDMQVLHLDADGGKLIRIGGITE